MNNNPNTNGGYGSGYPYNTNTPNFLPSPPSNEPAVSFPFDEEPNGGDPFATIDDDFVDHTQEDLTTNWFPTKRDCKCCRGYIFSCQGEICDTLGVCECSAEEYAADGTGDDFPSPTNNNHPNSNHGNQFFGNNGTNDPNQNMLMESIMQNILQLSLQQQQQQPSSSSSTSSSSPFPMMNNNYDNNNNNSTNPMELMQQLFMLQQQGNNGNVAVPSNFPNVPLPSSSKNTVSSFPPLPSTQPSHHHHHHPYHTHSQQPPLPPSSSSPVKNPVLNANSNNYKPSNTSSPSVSVLSASSNSFFVPNASTPSINHTAAAIWNNSNAQAGVSSLNPPNNNPNPFYPNHGNTFPLFNNNNSTNPSNFGATPFMNPPLPNHHSSNSTGKNNHHHNQMNMNNSLFGGLPTTLAANFASPSSIPSSASPWNAPTPTSTNNHSSFPSLNLGLVGTLPTTLSASVDIPTGPSALSLSSDNTNNVSSFNLPSSTTTTGVQFLLPFNILNESPPVSPNVPSKPSNDTSATTSGTVATTTTTTVPTAPPKLTWASKVASSLPSSGSTATTTVTTPVKTMPKPVTPSSTTKSTTVLPKTASPTSTTVVNLTTADTTAFPTLAMATKGNNPDDEPVHREIRRLTKKLKEIDELSAKDAAKLSSEQLTKIESRAKYERLLEEEKKKLK